MSKERRRKRRGIPVRKCGSYGLALEALKKQKREELEKSQSALENDTGLLIEEFTQRLLGSNELDVLALRQLQDATKYRGICSR